MAQKIRLSRRHFNGFATPGYRAGRKSFATAASLDTTVVVIIKSTFIKSGSVITRKVGGAVVVNPDPQLA